MLDVIIISYNGKKLTEECIKSLDNLSTKNINFKITIVDNNSNDDTVEFISNNYQDINIIANKKNLGYAAAINIGMKNTNSDFAIITNNDVVFTPDSIEKILNFLKENHNAAVVAPQQLYPDGKWQRSYGDFVGIKSGLKYLFLVTLFQNHYFRKFYKVNKRKRPKCVEYADGAVLCIKREIFNKVNGFDEDYFFYSEEMDFCYRVKLASYSVWHLPTSIVYHHRGGSDLAMRFTEKKQEMLIDSKILFCDKHLSNFEKKLYVLLEKLHHKFMLLSYKIICKLKNTEKTTSKLNYYQLMHRIWTRK